MNNIQAYIDAALWSSPMDDEDADAEFFDQSDAQLAPETITGFRATVQDFYAQNAALIEAAKASTGLGDDSLLHDLWLTQNRHGAGFWDGDWGAYGKALTDAAHKMGECTLYLGDNGMIYAA